MGDGDVLYMREEKSGDDESPSNDNDIWDDTALIEAYDHAVSLAKSEVEKRMNGCPDGQYDSSSESSVSLRKNPSSIKKEDKHLQGPAVKKVWSVGDPCRCSYSADGILYEANIIRIVQNKTAVVRYLGYDNEEEVILSDILPSRGRIARQNQEEAANVETAHQSSNVHKQKLGKESPSMHYGMDWESPVNNNRPSTSHGMDFPLPHSGMPQMMFPPPPPLNMLAASGCPSDESEALSAMLMSWYMSGFHTGYYQGMKQANAKSAHTSTRRK